MAVKKSKKEEAVEVAVDIKEEGVEVTPEVEVETPQVEVEEPKQDVEVDAKVAEVKASDRPKGTVKIRMRVDHKCCIAMERYDLKAGKVYTVPENVKNILNKAGLLAPL